MIRRLVLLVCLPACALENPDFTPKTLDLPVLRLTTEAAIESKDNYVAGSAVLGEATYAIEIKGHGNSTWELPKKPYKLKLSDKAELLGMPAGKDFVLLANYLDRTLIRTAVAFALSERMGLPYTPRSRFVEVFLTTTISASISSPSRSRRRSRA
jgi:hypothetical protein